MITIIKAVLVLGITRGVYYNDLLEICLYMFVFVLTIMVEEMMEG